MVANQDTNPGHFTKNVLLTSTMHHEPSTTMSSSTLNDDDEQETRIIKRNPENRSLPCTPGKCRRNLIILVSSSLLLLALIVLASLGFFSKDSMTSVNKPTNNVGTGTDSNDNATTSTPTASPISSPMAIPVASPTLKPTTSPTEPSPVTYRPGELTVQENGMILSKGLKSRLLAKPGENVAYHNGEMSNIPFHIRPDGAATFPVPDDYGSNKGGWVYVSNSEGKELGSGGVGAVMFDKDGNVIKYKNILNGTTMNCAGGRT